MAESKRNVKRIEEAIKHLVAAQKLLGKVHWNRVGMTREIQQFIDSKARYALAHERKLYETYRSIERKR